MARIKQITAQKVRDMTDEDIDRLPESFPVEYMNKGVLRKQLEEMGALYLEGKVGDDEKSVEVKGKLSDGTIITIKAEMGDQYLSPKEVAEQIRAQIKETEE